MGHWALGIGHWALGIGHWEEINALGYLDMGATIGKSDSSKVLFIDPRTIPAAFEGMRSVISNGQVDSNELFSKQIPGLENNRAS